MAVLWCRRGWPCYDARLTELWKRRFFRSVQTCQGPGRGGSEAAIGAILECRRCHSMVQVVPPDGWVLADEGPPACGRPRPGWPCHAVRPQWPCDARPAAA